MTGYVRAVAPQGEEVLLAEFLLSMLPGLDAKACRRLLKSGFVRVNGIRAAKDAPLCAGDVVEAVREGVFSQLKVAFEDSNVLVANKPAGVPVAQGEGSLLAAAAAHMRARDELIESAGCFPYACHDIGDDIGGLVVFAKNGEFYTELRRAFAQRRIGAYYVCVTVGAPAPEGEARGYLAEDGGRVRAYSTQGKGRVAAATRYRVMEQGGGLSLVRAQMITCRRHQLRVHMAGLGAPVLGDARYGSRKANRYYGVAYPAVWAEELAFYTGANNLLSYLDGTTVRGDAELPYAAFEE